MDRRTFMKLSAAGIAAGVTREAQGAVRVSRLDTGDVVAGAVLPAGFRMKEVPIPVRRFGPDTGSGLTRLAVTRMERMLTFTSTDFSAKAAEALKAAGANGPLALVSFGSGYWPDFEYDRITVVEVSGEYLRGRKRIPFVASFNDVKVELIGDVLWVNPDPRA